MKKIIIIFAILSFSMNAMKGSFLIGKYSHVLDIPHLKEKIVKYPNNSFISIKKQLCMHMVVQATRMRYISSGKQLKSLKPLKLKKLLLDFKKQHDNPWINFKTHEFYKVLSRIPWDGQQLLDSAFDYPVLINEKAMKLAILSYVTKCIPSRSLTEILTDYHFTSDPEHHAKIVEEFENILRREK